MLELDLSEIRKAFPDWPSELDVARGAGNWVGMAVAFHCAAIVLSQEMRRGHRDMHAHVGEPVDINVVRRTQVGPAVLFCLAFALELAIKAALVKQGVVKRLQSGERLPFLSHNLIDLAERIDGLGLSQGERACLDQASVIVATGKYPAGLKPRAEVNGVKVLPNLEDFGATADALYRRLQDLSTKDHS